MAPKRKSNGNKAPSNPKKNAKKARKESCSDDHSASEGEDAAAGFDKSKLQKQFKFNFKELMADPTFSHPEFVRTVKPEELTAEYFEKEGFDYPLHFRCDPRRIGMTVPHTSFSVNDVLELVGGNRMIEVVQVQDQGSVKMSLQEFIDFYNTPPKERKDLYNVLSLEFSLTPLEDLVKSPSLVRDIDWVGNRWPDALRQRWISFNGPKKKFYNPHHTFPKVQNYCLMSVANCYTDFHIDFSGTSVWYHVLKGRKVFWLIPPTETNFFIYQEFIKTVGDNAFFGKSVEKCHMAILEPGDTMLIPAGWIHAVYTPEDSLVFGGNFLHSLSCKMQIRVYQVENKLNITRKFRLPYNEELIFYVIGDYVKKWTGREYVRPLRLEDAKLDYVGAKWKAAGGHLKKIVYSDYETGVELTNEMIGGEEGSSKDEVKVIAMHAESSVFGSPMISKTTFSVDINLEKEEEEEEEEEADYDQKYEETKEEAEARRDAEIDELARTNPQIFYKNSKHDFVRNKCVPDHKLPIGHEPPLCFDHLELSKITPRLLDELEALGSYLRRKGRVEVAEGICQPASLLHAFNTVLKKRRAELEGKTFECPLIMPRRYTRSAIETGEYNDFQPGSPPEDHARRTSRFKVEDFPDELLEIEDEEKEEKKQVDTPLPSQPSSGPLEYVPTPISTTDGGQNGGETEDTVEENGDNDENENEDEDYEEDEDEDDDDYNEEEYVPSSTPRRTSARRSATKQAEEETGEEVEKKPKKEKVKKEKKSREQRQKEKEKRIRESELDAELRAAHGGGAIKSKKKKPEKPAYVGGLPTSAIQNEPVVSNPYNFDPKAEIMKLGTGQLKSAYRKTRNNVELHIEKNLYKLEPKRGSNEEEDDSREASEEYDQYATYQPRPANNQSTLFDYSRQDDYDEIHPPAKRSKLETASVDDPPRKKKDSRDSRPTEYTPSYKITTPPSSGSHSKKLSSTSLFSPPAATKSSERRVSDTSTPAMRKGVYMPSMSRQDKLIAEAAASRVASSDRRSSFIPPISSVTSTPRSSQDGASMYTPSAVSPTTPMRSSWLPDTSTISRHSTDDSLIDVVNDSMSPIDVINSPPFPASITPPPFSLSELTNGRKNHNQDEGKKAKISSKEAMLELKSLVMKLNSLNDV